MEEKNENICMEGKKEADEEERIGLGVSSSLRDVTEKKFEVDIPEIAIDLLKVKEGDKLQFIMNESNKRIYVEKAEG